MVADPHYVFKAPNNKTVKVWRYMDLAKFVWCLQRRALFLTRADKLGDPYEGYYTKRAHAGENAFVEFWMQSETYKGIETENQYRAMFRELLEKTKRKRQEYCASCWHMNEYESAAMWRLYTSLSKSICIMSSFQRLQDALPSETFLGMVKYINYETDDIDVFNGFNFIMHKRESYSHEREVRAVVRVFEEDELKFKFEVGENGVVVPVDLPTLIEAVYLSPSGAGMLREVVSALLTTHGLNVRVLQSEVNAPPAY